MWFRVKLRWLVVSAFFVLSLVLISFVFVDPARFHWFQYEWLKSRGRAMTHSNYINEIEEWSLGHVSDRLYAHIESLENLGEVEAHAFRAKYSVSELELHKQSKWYQTVEQGRSCGELLASRGVVEPKNSGHQITMTIWCRPEFSEKWEALAAEFDASRDKYGMPWEETELK